MYVSIKNDTITVITDAITVITNTITIITEADQKIICFDNTVFLK